MSCVRRIRGTSGREICIHTSGAVKIEKIPYTKSPGWEPGGSARGMDNTGFEAGDLPVVVRSGSSVGPNTNGHRASFGFHQAHQVSRAANGPIAHPRFENPCPLWSHTVRVSIRRTPR